MEGFIRHQLTARGLTTHHAQDVSLSSLLTRARGDGDGLEKGWALRSGGGLWRGGSGRLSTASTRSTAMPITINIPYRTYEARLREGRLRLEGQPCPR
jgi:hypothetical protein